MKTHIPALLEKSDEFLVDAFTLLNNNGFSSSVSRSYYAMFHAAQAMLLSQGIIAHTHKGVILNFSNAFLKTQIFDIELGKAFVKIQDKREKSDYEVGFKATKEQASQTYQVAVEFIDKVKIYLGKLSFIN